jgi:hypothetical protein
MAIAFHDDAGLPLSRREIDAADDVHFCERHIETFPGDHCPRCSDGNCEGCKEAVPKGSAAMRDCGLIWCSSCAVSP